jgi:hypothetical protein
LLVEAQRAMQGALSSLMDQGTPPDVRACVEELCYAASWFRDGLERQLPRGRDRDPGETVGPLGISAQRIAELPTFVDRLRLIGQAQRWMVAQIAVLLAEDLQPELRDLLQEASAIYLRGGRRCDEVIAMLDRERELPPPTE